MSILETGFILPMLPCEVKRNGKNPLSSLIPGQLSKAREIENKLSNSTPEDTSLELVQESSGVLHATAGLWPPPENKSITQVSFHFM